MSHFFGPEEGHYALALGCVLATMQGVFPLIGLRRSYSPLTQITPALALSQCLALLFSFTCLITASIDNDFSVRNIAENSAINKPLLYKITGVWGNHEGSILLWVVILGLCGAALTITGWRNTLPLRLKVRTLSILGFISSGFELFCLLTSNPFERLLPVPSDGLGMNPLLQDPGLAFHPPILYAGYVGFSVPFAFAVAALIDGKTDAQWGYYVRPWTISAWSMLTIGIAMGSWWSYYVLGWGGYWFWDPVENASLIPWLSGTALLHSAIVVEKRESLKVWTLLLALITFSFSLSGTFLVRSGILNSVHAFANDPTRGFFILALLGLVTGGSLTLFAWRAPQLSDGDPFTFFSREGALVLNNILLCTICAIVLTGTLYPPFMQLLFEKTLSVGKPFFDSTTSPLIIPLLGVMGISTALSWKKASIKLIQKRLYYTLIPTSCALLSALYYLHDILAIICAVMAVWMISATLNNLITRLFTSSRRFHLPRSIWGTSLAHIGVGITILGLCGMSAAHEEVIDARIGDHGHLLHKEWFLSAIHAINGANYRALQADIIFSDASHRSSITLHPEIRIFPAQHQRTLITAIHSTLLGDTYAVLGEAHRENNTARYILRLHNNPLAPWIWGGGILMAIGGSISLSGRRHKQPHNRCSSKQA